MSEIVNNMNTIENLTSASRNLKMFFAGLICSSSWDLKKKYLTTGLELEESIITNLQNFLVEMGRGFCFEARQKRIIFDNIHYRIDLLFSPFILKCHVLLGLKIGEFDHSDAR